MSDVRTDDAERLPAPLRAAVWLLAAEAAGMALVTLFLIYEDLTAEAHDLVAALFVTGFSAGGALVLALLGPIGFVRRFIRRFAIWAVPLALVYLTWWTLDGADLGALWNAEGEGGLTAWQGADVVVGITVSWVPFAADYTRFSKTRRGAFAGTGLGYFVPDVWLLALGTILVLSRDLGDDWRGTGPCATAETGCDEDHLGAADRLGERRMADVGRLRTVLLPGRS